MNKIIAFVSIVLISVASFAQNINFDNNIASISTKISYIKDVAHLHKAVLGKPEGQKGLLIKNAKEDANPALLYLAQDTILINGNLSTFDDVVTVITNKGAEAEKIREEIKAAKEAEKLAKKEAKAAEKAKIKAEKEAEKAAKKAENDKKKAEAKAAKIAAKEAAKLAKKANKNA